MSLGKKWIALAFMIAYALSVSAYSAWSSPFAIAHSDAATAFLLIAGLSMWGIWAPTFGFILLVGLLDIFTERRPQPLSALILALAVFATIEGATQILAVQAYKNFLPTAEKPSEPAAAPAAPSSPDLH
jgi:hypothetical protein